MTDLHKLLIYYKISNKLNFINNKSIFKEFNIHICKINYCKLFFIEKVNGILHFYINKLSTHINGILALLIFINKNYNITDFSLTAFSFKFRPRYSSITDKHPITGERIYNMKVFGMCTSTKNKEIPMCSYYIYNPIQCFHKERYNVNINLLTSKHLIDYLFKISQKKYSINKLVFRYNAPNIYRHKLCEIYKDNNLFDIKNIKKTKHNFIPFTEQRKYKYILDMHGLDGHSGRRFWMFHFNRVLFLPIDDPLKLFWEISDDPPIPWKHFVPYSLNNLEEIESNVLKLENDPKLYAYIKKKSHLYAIKNLSFDKIIDLHVNNLNNLN